MRDGVVRRGETWTYVIRSRDRATGRSRPRWVGGFSTEAAAKAARDEARVAMRRGIFVDRSSTTVAAFLREWLQSHSVAVKATTLAGYERDLEIYVIPRIGGLNMQSVRAATVSGLYRELLTSGGRHGRPLSPVTVDHVHRVLRKAFNDAVDVEELLSSNPVARATRPKAPTREPFNLWTGEQLDGFLGAAARHRLGAFFRLAAYTGARRGELIGMRWEQIDFDSGELIILGSTSTVHGVRIAGTPKSGRSRVIGLDTVTLDVLRQHMANQDAERLAARNWWQDSGENLVFRTADGRPVHTDTPTALMPKLISLAGVPHARLHDLRHLHASTLLLANVPAHVVSERLGHADPTVTLRVYAHTSRESGQGLADIFAAAMSGSSERARS
jgi:integrase